MIDPVLIKSADFFKSVVMEFPLVRRIEIGSPVQYFLDHTVEERFNQISRLTGYPDHVLEFLIKLGDPRAFGKYEDLRKFLPEEIASNPFIFTHVLYEKLPIDQLRNHPNLINYLPPLVELTTTTRNDKELREFGISARKMFLIYILFVSLNIDTDCFKYYKHSIDMEESLNSIGYSSKAIFKIIIQRSREFYGTDGFLNEVLDIKYLNNYVDPKKVIRSILGDMRTSQSKLEKNVLRTLWSSISFCVDIDGVQTRGGLSSIFSFYIYRYKRWANHSDVVIMDNGAEFYSHRHTMLTAFNRSIEKKDSHQHAQVKLPKSIDTPPGEALADFIQSYAKKQYRKLLKEHGNVKFKNMDDKFKHLNPTEYKYLDNAIDLVVEGRNMSHCVGGEDYIYGCYNDQTYILHYNDGDDRHGYTIELSSLSNGDIDNRNCLLFTSFDRDTQKWMGFRVYQIKGYDNNEPADHVKMNILLDLINASIKFREVPENAVKREVHNYRLSMIDRHPVLADHTTRRYRIVDIVGDYIPFKSVMAKEENWKRLNPSLVYRYGIQLTNRPERSPGEYENRMHQLLYGARFPAGLAGDFQGDEVNDIAAQIMHGRLRGIHPREPELNRGWFDGMRADDVDMDLQQLYPHQQQILSAKHLAGHSLMGERSSTVDRSNVPLLTLTKKTQTRNAGKALSYPAVTLCAGFWYNTGREYFVGQALHSLGNLYSSWWEIDGKLPLMADLGVRLLANKIRYGFMSDEEIIRTTFLISEHGYNLFCSEVSILANIPTGSIRKSGHAVTSRGTMYQISSTPHQPRAGMTISTNSDVEVTFSFSESADMWHHFNDIREKTDILGFDFNDKFSRNLLGRYGVRFN